MAYALQNQPGCDPKKYYPDDHPFNYKHAYIIMDIKEHPEVEDIKMWIIKCLDPNQQRELEKKFDFVSSNINSP